MKSRVHHSRETVRFATKLAFALLFSGLCGCASDLATVKAKPARLPTGLRVEEPLASATKCLLAAEHEQSSVALGHDLVAAKMSYEVLERHPKNESARAIYSILYRAFGLGVSVVKSLRFLGHDFYAA
jgi:hypothetical protein